MAKKLPITSKQKAFCREYVIDHNCTQAAVRAGYSKKTAESQGSRLLTNVNVSRYLGTLQAKISKKTEINAAWVLNRLAAEVLADVADLYDANNKLKPVAEWPIEFRQGLVAGIDAEGGIKMSDRLKRLELIGKHIGVQAFNEKSSLDIGLSSLSDDELALKLAGLRGDLIEHKP